MIKVNLLPDEIKDDVGQSKENGFILKLFIFSIIILAIVGSVFVGMTLYFNDQLTKASTNLAEKEQVIKKYGDLEDKSKKIAGRIDDAKKIMDGTNIWSGVIEEIQKVMPGGIQLKSVKLDSAEKARCQIDGFAVSKKELAAFRDTLENSAKFEFVDVEVSKTVREPKIEEQFTITFSIAKGGLK